MRTLFFILLLPIFCAAQAPVPEPRDRAAAAVRDLSQVLQQLLGEELRRGGYADAVKACSESAQVVTEEFGKERGLDIRRVSLKYRNPKDQPDDWEAAKLRLWALAPPGKQPADYIEIVTENGRRFLRYMKPIMVHGMCLACHGPPDNISSEVRDVLNIRYPRDKATGYKPGDLRGAFSVIVALPD